MIAIHHRKNSFSEKWIEYCDNNNLAYKLVNCYDSDIIKIMNDFDILLWHWSHTDEKANLFAKELILILEKMGKKVFPNYNTVFHFDNKIIQKYLLESVTENFIPSYIFYSRNDAEKWVHKQKYPLVFKLKNGAGSSNVKLIKHKKEALSLIKKAFSVGFSNIDYVEIFKNRLNFFISKKDFNSFFLLIKSFLRLFIKGSYYKTSANQKNYIYFQKFIPNNNYDIRIVIIGNKAFGIKRNCHKNDFRASGSGNIDYSKNSIDLDCIKIAFELTKKMKSQCTAYDFVFENNKPLVVEISYGFTAKAYYKCEGYWDQDLHWINEKVIPEYFIIENILSGNS